MSRFKLTIEYDGTRYAGWQRQDEHETVQGAIEAALEGVFQKRIELTAAGRTDAGVHALGQVAHCDIENTKGMDAGKLMLAINAHLLQHDVVIVGAEKVTDDFHARFSAKNKLYRYVIINRQPRPALDANRAWHVRTKLDEVAMHKAAQALLGTHDFTSFRDSECQGKSPVKTLNRLDVVRHGDYVVIEAEGKSFLHHQVRNMAGTLVQFGKGRATQTMKALLAAKDRRQTGETAPAQGLTLVRVDYD